MEKSPLDFTDEDVQTEVVGEHQTDSTVADVEDEDTEKSPSFISMGGPPDDIYQPNWGITNSCRLDNPLVCQELVDHIIPPG
ncbi:hypothetical protein Tco_0384050 [Tanacetum coccineum]